VFSLASLQADDGVDAISSLFSPCMLVAGWWLWLPPQENEVPVYEAIPFFPRYAVRLQLFVGLHWHLDQGLT